MSASTAVGVLPARWGSTRFPGKSLALIAGKPLIVRVLERARLARRLREIVVATDDVRIRKAVENAGGRVVMTRPDHPSGTDRVADAASAMTDEIIVNIQGDEPLMDPVLIDRLVDVMIAEPDLDMATAASPLADESEADMSSVCKVVMDVNDRAMYFSRHPIPFVRDADFQAGGTLRWRHIGIYLYRRDFLGRLVAEPPCLLEKAECLEQLRALHLGARIKVVRTLEPGLGVDVPGDIARVEALIRREQGGVA